MAKRFASLKVKTLDGVMSVTINRPRKHNALSRQVLAELAEAFKGGAGQDDLKVAVVTGAGNKSFAAGGDLRDLQSVRSRVEAVAMAEDAKAAFETIRRFPLPVVAALNGDALGGGAELAVACDFRLFAHQARIGFVQGRLNISTAWGGGVDLMRLVGPAVGLQLLCRSQMIAGPQAVALGLGNATATAGQSLEELLEDFLAPLVAQAPRALRAFKQIALAARFGESREAMLKLETEAFSHTWVHEDHWAAAEALLGGRR